MEQKTGSAVPTMRADAKALARADVDVTPLVGTWFNAKRDTDHIAKIMISERDGAVLVRLCGSERGRLVDWGEVPAKLYVHSGTRTLAGFHASFDLDTTRIEVAASVRLGILVTQTYTSYRDASGRPGRFSREVFHPKAGDPAARAARNGPHFLAGEWVNTNPDAAWITEFSLVEKGDACALRVRCASEPFDWGEADVTTHLDASGDPAFHAAYDLGPIRAELAANTGMGIIILATFLHFVDREQTNAFTRECFVSRLS